jgi:hypothetical protein
MDPISGGFAYYDFVGDALVYDNTQVADKMNRNSDVFPEGHETVDDSWMNNWLEGPNATIGWNGPTSGNGAASIGEAIGNTDAFPVCMSEKVFEFVCLRKPESSFDRKTISELADNFVDSGLKMKSLFADSITKCAGE